MQIYAKNAAHDLNLTTRFGLLTSTIAYGPYAYKRMFDNKNNKIYYLIEHWTDSQPYEIY